MMDLSRYQGTGQFGPAYRIMLENDCHAPGSVDRVLTQRMIRLCPQTADALYQHYTPSVVKYQRGSRPQLERCLEECAAGSVTQKEWVAAIARFCSGLGEGVGDNLDAMRVGGTEEEIIRRGSDWCTDVARAACILCQVAGVPARLVDLADTGKAYSGHAIIEAYRSGTWGAVDPTVNVIYRHPEGEPATTWELMNNPRLIEAHGKRRTALYANPGQFRAAAVSNYFIWQHERYDYTVSPLNEYCLTILGMSSQGWPGGLRWLHGEDRT